MPVLENYKILIHSLRNIHRELGFNWISNFLEGITYSEESTYGIFSSQQNAEEAKSRIEKLPFFSGRALVIREWQLDGFGIVEDYEKHFKEDISRCLPKK